MESWSVRSKKVAIQKLLEMLQKTPLEDEAIKTLEALKKFRAFQIQNDLNITKRSTTTEDPHLQTALSNLRDKVYDEYDDNVGSEILDDDETFKVTTETNVENFFNRGKYNQKDKKDRSREEVRSSWSSSEEALAACEGVVKEPMALNGATKCHPNASDADLGLQMEETKLEYDVTSTGIINYHYIIFY